MRALGIWGGARQCWVTTPRSTRSPPASWPSTVGSPPPTRSPSSWCAIPRRRGRWRRCSPDWSCPRRWSSGSRRATSAAGRSRARRSASGSRSRCRSPRTWRWRCCSASASRGCWAEAAAALAAGAVAALAFLLDPEAQHFATGGFTELPFTLGVTLALLAVASGAATRRPLLLGLLLGITGASAPTCCGSPRPLPRRWPCSPRLRPDGGSRLWSCSAGRSRSRRGGSTSGTPSARRASTSRGSWCGKAWKAGAGSACSTCLRFRRCPHGGHALTLLADKADGNIGALLLALASGPRALWVERHRGVARHPSAAAARARRSRGALPGDSRRARDRGLDPMAALSVPGAHPAGGGGPARHLGAGGAAACSGGGFRDATDRERGCGRARDRREARGSAGSASQRHAEPRPTAASRASAPWAISRPCSTASWRRASR